MECKCSFFYEKSINSHIVEEGKRPKRAAFYYNSFLVPGRAVGREREWDNKRCSKSADKGAWCPGGCTYFYCQG